jgi:hypothetical protein
MLPPPPDGWTGPIEIPLPEDRTSSARPNVTIETTGLAHVSMLTQELLVMTFDTEGKLGTPEVLDADRFSDRAAFGIDANDVSIAVWPGPTTNDRNDELMASRHPPGGTWSKPVSVGTGFPDVAELSLAVSTNGTAVAVWIIPYGAVRYSHFDGSEWSVPSDVAPLEANSLAFPSVSLDASGKGLVVWRDYTPADVIGASRFNGTTFEPPTDLCPESAMECYLPGVAVNADGDGMAAFELDYTLHGLAFDRTLGWQTPERIATLDRADYAAAPKLGYSAANELLLIWREEIDDYDFRCLGALKTSTGWQQTQLQPEPGETDTKALAVAPDGRAVAIWASNGTGTTPDRFWAAYYVPASGWGPAFVLDEGGAAGAAEVAAAINPNGQAVVSWTHWVTPPRVRVARFDPP